MLFVNDNPDTLDLLSELFSGEHNVHIAVTSENAFEAVRENPIDIAFIDIILADDENGYTLAEELNQAFPNLSLKLMSSLSKEYIRTKFGDEFPVLSKMELVLATTKMFETML